MLYIEICYDKVMVEESIRAIVDLKIKGIVDEEAFHRILEFEYWDIC